MICIYCGGDHSWFYCRTKPEGWKPPKKSTAARKDVQKGAIPPAPGTLDSRPAGTQAPPVDTKRGRGRPKTITDMRSYKAEKAKEYRKRRAAQKEG